MTCREVSGKYKNGRENPGRSIHIGVATAGYFAAVGIGSGLSDSVRR